MQLVETMKKTTVFLILIILGLAACTPNRLQKSLVTKEPVVSGETPLPAPTPSGRSLQPQLGQADIDLDEVVALLPPDAIPAVLPKDAPKIMVTAAKADAAGMGQTFRIIGVSINGDSRAYPTPYLSAHEIVNDVVGGQPIAATW